MEIKRKVKFKDRLSFRQAKNSVLAAFIVGVLMSVIQIGNDYFREKDALVDFVDEIMSATRFAAADASFYLDAQAAEEVAKGLLEYRSIQNVTITTEDNLELANLSRRSVVDSSEQQEFKVFGDLREFDIPLVAKTGEMIGNFSITVDPSVAGSDFINRSILVVILGIVRNILLAFVLIFLFHHMITKRLDTFTKFLEKTDITKPDQKHFDDVKTEIHDEFSELTGCVNDMLEIISEDIKERIHREKKLQESDAQLSYQASHDSLTGLVNRREFEKRVQNALQVAQNEDTSHVLCYLDLDQFKIVNDTSGHTAGDELLRQTGNIIKQGIRKHDTLARLGGDEFGILMEHCNLKHATKVAENICKTVEDFNFAWGTQSFRVGVSIGVVPITNMTTNTDDLFQSADVACYAAKDAGRNRVHCYIEDDKETLKKQGEMKWVSRINNAIEEDRFKLYAQPIIDLNNQTSRLHFEILVRMVDENGYLISPNSFLPAAERYNIMGRLDRLVIKKSFEFFVKNPDTLKQISIYSINLSGQSLSDPNLARFIIKKFNEHGISPAKCCFEITETTAIANLSIASEFIQSLKNIGCKFALDDFGSGLSSFAYLKNLPVDYLKIDGMFVKDICDDPIDLAMVKSIHEIGKVMNKKTIAEFVENNRIKNRLIDIGIDYAQGYGISSPFPIEDITYITNQQAV